ncbi:MAG TPA: outer membrane beta-barrel protein [Beijerinckiaceae bacterium]|nr:outer membrane beta-barrel protein [Beijerinckiaceae bacterium]
MGKFRALVLASALALGGVGMAHAADLLPSPPPLEPFAPSPSPEFSGWYLRGDVGVGIASLGKMSSTLAPGFFVPDYRYDEASLSDSTILGAGVGYQFNNWFRADVTGEYRSSQHYNAATSYTNYITGAGNSICGDVATNPRCFDFYHGSVQSSVFLANGYADLGTWWHLTPFIGAGAGVAYNRFGSIYDVSIGNSGGGYSAPVSKTNFAWALMAGLDWTVNPRLKMELSYRYLNLGNAPSGPIVCQNTSGCALEQQNFRLASQDIRIGMRWMFNSYEPMPEEAPPPIVTKY